MIAFDALTWVFMWICGLLAILMALLKFPELASLALVGYYYFAVFHIAHIVGESRGWYRDALPTLFLIMVVTIATFAIVYYRYGLMYSGAHTDISILDALYFSVTTWTTLGYGDFSPIPRIRHITSIEAFLGYVGLGLWISLISSFVKNMADNRQSVREHNEKLMESLNRDTKKKTNSDSA